jgi:tetratricopeptide (TPR) repeat protein
VLSECPQCGQKLRSKWLRCPRCRLLLPDASAPAPGEASGGAVPAGPRRWWIGGGVGLMAIFVLVIATRGNTPAATTPAEVPPASRGAAPEDEAATTAVLGASAGHTVSIEAVDSKRAAAAAYATGDYSTALSQLQAAVASSPDDAEARNNLGQLFIRLGRAAESLPHFDEAVRLDGRRWAYRFNRARAFGLLNRWPEASAEYRVAATLFPDDHATLYNLGLALLRVRDYPGAVAALEQAVAAAPEDHSFLITLGTAYVGAEQSDRARETFERFLEVAPSDAEAPRVRALLEALAAAGR